MADNSTMENLDNSVPLEKPLATKPPKVPKEPKVPIESIVSEKGYKERVRKPKTPGQLEQFEKVRLKRLEDLRLKKEKQKVEAAALLLQHDYVKKEPKDAVKKTATKKEGSGSDSEPEIVVVKKKKKRVVVVREDSESEDEYDPPVRHVHTSRPMVSQQNKKSVIKVHTPQHINYFVD